MGDQLVSSSAPAPSVSTPFPTRPEELELLTSKLYPRLRSRLRDDLLADRERAGRLFDAR